MSTAAVTAHVSAVQQASPHVDRGTHHQATTHVTGLTIHPLLAAISTSCASSGTLDMVDGDPTITSLCLARVRATFRRCQSASSWPAARLLLLRTQDSRMQLLSRPWYLSTVRTWEQVEEGPTVVEQVNKSRCCSHWSCCQCKGMLNLWSKASIPHTSSGG
jgi:hypothetical protein